MKKKEDLRIRKTKANFIPTELSGEKFDVKNI